MPSLVVIGPQIKEKQREGAQCPAYMVPKDPSLNRVKDSLMSTSSDWPRFVIRENTHYDNGKLMGM